MGAFCGFPQPNASLQLLPEAGAQRTLEAVSCKALLGQTIVTTPASIVPRHVDVLLSSLLRAYSIRARRSCKTARRANRSPSVGHQRVRRQSQLHQRGVKITAWLRTTP